MIAVVGSMKRVAADVGESSSAIRSVHQYLAQSQEHDLSGQPAPLRLPAGADVEGQVVGERGVSAAGWRMG